ncbi:hypothetical protein [Zobellella iuensis]|uniref:Uncharacterized protein n=1 Tax=Zobellella iuensis TaxID=2803811 RepID=A0ABS1QVK0_9GAMM|nr:hypothetical protein [Zobellella iuensis]MBL1378897.1 hypothetical protein [Zobellella iuensis]
MASLLVCLLSLWVLLLPLHCLAGPVFDSLTHQAEAEELICHQQGLDESEPFIKPGDQGRLLTLFLAPPSTPPQPAAPHLQRWAVLAEPGAPPLAKLPRYLATVRLRI